LRLQLDLLHGQSVRLTLFFSVIGRREFYLPCKKYSAIQYHGHFISVWHLGLICVIISSPGARGTKYCDQSICRPTVCGSVCLSARIHVSQKHIPNLHKIFCTCHLWSWFSPCLTIVRCVDVLLVLWITSCVHIMEQYSYRLRVYAT